MAEHPFGDNVGDYLQNSSDWLFHGKGYVADFAASISELSSRADGVWMQMYVTPPDTDVYSIPRVLAPMPQKVIVSFLLVSCNWFSGCFLCLWKSKKKS